MPLHAMPFKRSHMPVDHAEGAGHGKEAAFAIDQHVVKGQEGTSSHLRMAQGSHSTLFTACPEPYGEGITNAQLCVLKGLEAAKRHKLHLCGATRHPVVG